MCLFFVPYTLESQAFSFRQSLRRSVNLASMSICATCAQPVSDTLSELKVRPPRQTPCCDRTICGACQAKNTRFQVYCPFCQITSAPSTLPQGLRDPPAYEESGPSEKGHTRLDDMKRRRRYEAEEMNDDSPPGYNESVSSSGNTQTNAGGYSEANEDTVHYLRHSDTLASISLAYNVPLQILRTHNNLYSDHLISARHEISIPASHYRGPSLSAEPVESEEERQRKARLRRFMMRTKCSDYGMAEVYLKDAKEDVDQAVRRWEDDERWERENPMKKARASGVSRNGFGSGLTDQLR